MNSVSQEIIKDLARQLLQQGAIIDALCDILVDKNVITEEELNGVIDDYILDQEKYIEEIKQQQKSEIDLGALHFGPIGEC